MLKDVKWSEDGTYTPQGEHTPIEFFNNALKNSVLFDIQLGYFNSAAIHVLASSFASFIKNGGLMRMAINQIVSKKDKDAIIDGFDGGINAPLDLSDWNSVKESLDEYGEHFFRCLAYLIQERRIEIQIIKPASTSGIAHTKRGQFIDEEGMVVGFSGSANFTLGGLFNNLENIDIFLSTSPDTSIQKKLENNKTLFSNIMSRSEPDVEYLDVSNLEEAIKTTFGDQDINDLLDVEEKLRKYKIKHSSDIAAEADVEDLNQEPRFPYPSGPHEYQKLAYEKWMDAGKRGFFAMATGTGKTITSLNCLYNNYLQNGTYKAIILVPTIALVEQWQRECFKFNFKNIVKISSKSQWQDYLSDIIMTCLLDSDEQSYIILVTYASFVKKNVYNRLFELPRETMIIADEAHNMGSPSLVKIMPDIPFEERIGLSATPDRKFDDEGNSAICSFFGITEKNYTFVYTMKEAIDKDVLCHYRYFPKIVHLTDDEMNEYKKISVQIAKFYDPETNSLKDNPVLTALLLKRKRIIHKAQNKLALFQNIINDIYIGRGSLKYMMVYVPEGVSQYDEEFSFATESDADDDVLPEPLIDKYTTVVANVSPTMTVEQFTSRENDRNEILRRFASGKTQVLTAMKCLDEGVDVPRAEYAIFCASTGNPRQFIQRRGRILRTHKDKSIAYIYDMVVVPRIDKSSNTFEMERSMLKKELERVFDFASLATNKSYTKKELESTLDYYKLNFNSDEN